MAIAPAVWLLLWQLKIGKIENMLLLLCHCRYLDKSLHMEFMQIGLFGWLPWQENVKHREIETKTDFKKILSSETMWPITF